MCTDRLIGSIFVTFCIFSWLYLIPTYVKGDEQAIYPQLVIGFLFLPAILMCLFPKKRPVQAACPLPQLLLSYAPVLKLSVLYIVYILGVQYIGFYSASFVFSIVFLLFFGERRGLFLLLFALGISMGIYAVIGYFLNFPLPAELLF